jgi:N6-L-threonylcarbamoyladenine synthase
MFTLGIDTSNYASSLAVFDAARRTVVADCKRFLPVKAGGLGLRQSDAVFHHTAALPELLRQLGAAFPLRRVGAVGVSEKPRPAEGSYMPCFLTGVSAAQGIALARGVPLIRTTHQQGHIAAALFAADSTLLEKRVLVFHISGGTTELLLCEGARILRRIGASTDLYAGQAVDRIGVRLGFAFPAGAELSRLAAQCGEDIRPKVSVKGADCSFSGLENQCAALLKRGEPPAYVAKYCLLAVARTVLQMIRAARAEEPDTPVVCAGGVMSSDLIRAAVQKEEPEAMFVPGKYASDNAIGVAILAARACAE